MKSKHNVHNYLFTGLFLVVAIISFFIIKDLIFAILYSIVLAFFFYPLYDRINSFLKVRSISAIIVILIIIFIVTIPLVFISNRLINESVEFYDIVKGLDLGSTPFIKEGLQSVITTISVTANDFLHSLPTRLLNIFVSLFLLFYFFIDGKMLFENFKNLLPLNKKKKNIYFNEFKNVAYSVVYGSVFTGIIIGILFGIGFYIFKVESPIILAFITMILVILPIVGSALVWFPISILKLVNGDTTNGVGLMIYGLILSLSASLLSYRIMSRKAKLHPALIVIGVIGGLKFFGFIGVIFGPFVLVLLITMLKYMIVER